MILIKITWAGNGFWWETIFIINPIFPTEAINPYAAGG